MVDLKKVLSLFVCMLMLPFGLILASCKEQQDPPAQVIPKLELMYTDIHLLENSTIDVKIIIEPQDYKDKEIVVNLPQSNCLQGATIETIDNQKYLRIQSASYLENESEILKGAYIYFKDYEISQTQKSFGVTVHKTALILDKPQDLVYDENLGTIEWKKVEGARFYEVSINDEILSTSLTSMVLNESYYGKKLDVKIRSVYDLVNKFPAFVDSDFTEVLTFMVLQKPQNLRHENQVIYWDRVEGAKSYSLIISTPSIFGDRQNEKVIPVEATTKEVESYSGYNFASSTTYTIRVKANGNTDQGYTVYGTQDSKSIQVKKLTAPSNLTFTQGVLSWDNIEQNNGYEVVVTRYNTLSEKYDHYKTETVTKANSYAFDTFNGSIPSGQYMFSVKTMGDNKTTLSGEDVQSTVTTKLESINNLRIENGGIYWNKVEMATSYTIYLNATPITLINDDQEFNSYFLGSTTVAGEYTIEVVACGDGTTFYNSNKSQTLTATKLNPTNLTLYQNELSWKKVSGATNYVLYLNTQEIVLGDVDSYTVTNELESGEYTAKVMATCEGKLSSEYSKAIKFNKLQAPSNLRVEDGLVKWDKVDKGTTYNLYFTYGDLPQDVSESTYSKMTMVKNYYDFKGEKAGNYGVYVTASGGENTITSSQTQTMLIKKLATPTTPWVENGKLSYETIESGTLMVKIKETSQEVVAENFKPSKDAIDLSLCLYAKGNNGENGENLVSSGDSLYLPTKVISSLTTPSIKDGKLIHIFPEGVTGVKIDFYKSGSLKSCYQIVSNKETEATDFVGSIDLRCYDNPELGAGFYNLDIIPQFPSATIESINNGNKAYIYSGKEMKLSFCQLDKPQLIGSYCLNQEGINAINQNVNEEDFDTIVKNYDTNKYSGYLYWSKISGATAYLLKINNDDNTTKVVYPSSLIFTEDNRCLYRLDGDFTTDMNGYNFAVKALGDESSYLSGEYSQHTDVNKIKLNQVGEIKVKDGNLTWNAIDGAFYEVSYNGNIAYTYKNTYNLPENSSSGVYQIKVRALPKSEFYYAGEYSTRDNIVKISSPIKFYIAGGQVQWSVVNNASRYVLDINGLTKEFNQEDKAFDLKNIVNTEDYFTQKDGNFDIQFTVIGTEDSDKIQSEYLYLSSSPLKISTTIMTAPSSIYVENGVLTWTPITGAQKYYLEFYNSANSGDVKNAYIDTLAGGGNKFSLGKDYESGLYYFTVTAIGNGSNYLDSPKSKEYSAQKLSVLDDIKIVDGKLTFTERAGATSYNAQINVYEDENVNVENFNGNVFALGSNYSSGRYQIKIQAVGNTTSQDNVNEICYLSSDYSQYVTGFSELTTKTVNYVYKLAPSSNMYVANDAINWEKVENAVGYNLQVDQTLINLKDTGSIELKSGNINGKFYEFSSGSFNVNVQTFGGTYFLNSNFRDTNMIATKLDEVLGLGVEEGVISWNTVNNIPDNLALYINGEFKTNLRQSFFETYDKNIGGVRGDKTYYVLGQDYGPGDYEIYFVNSGGGTTGYLSSDACESITVSKIDSPTNVGIDSTTNSIVWEMPTIENTSIKYTINLYDYQTDTLVQTFDTLDELSLVIKSLDVGKYYVRVGTVVKSSDKLLINSDISDKLMVTMPAIPIGLKIENGVISWNAIEGVSGYNLEISFYEGTSLALSGNESLFRITLNNENQNNVAIKDFTSDETFVSLAGTGLHSQITTLGKYKVRVNAFVSNSLQSNYSDFAGDTTQNGVNGYYLFQMFSDGKGTKASPYKITNFEQLKNIAYLPSLCYQQTTNIVTNGMPFTSIGSPETKFTGEYDGANFNIDNLVLVCSDPEVQGYNGMFGYVGESGVIKNINIIKATSTQGYYVGGVCGYNEGIIYNVKIQNGNIESETQTSVTTPKPIYIGGICGYNSLNAIIDKCTFKGYVTTIDTLTNYVSYSGGICGYNYGTICQSVTDKFNTSDKVMGTYAGGICGYNINTISYVDGEEEPIGSIYKCTNKIDVACYSLKNASSTIPGAAGGIAGMNILKADDSLGKCVTNNYSIAFSNSFATVICDPNETGLVPYAGGLVGYAGNGLYSCYAVGAVYGQINGQTTTDVGSGAPLVNIGRVIGYKGANNYQIDYCFYNELADTTLNSVGAESRLSRTNGLRVGSNCYAISEETFTNATLADTLNAGLIDNNHTAVWTNIIGEYPTFTLVDRVFE